MNAHAGIDIYSHTRYTFESANDKTYNTICVISKDSDQPVHPV